MTIGAVLILAALSLLLWNLNEDKSAAKASAEVIPQILEKIERRSVETEETAEAEENEVLLPAVDPDEEPVETEMTQVLIAGQNYIGYILIPQIELEVPVIAECDDNKLKLAPCRYSGTTEGDDIVIAGHNYTKHFGRIPELSAGDEVYFINMDGVAVQYEVVATDILAATDIEDMTAGDYDLTMFTCNYSGQNRITVRCDRVDQKIR